MVKFKSLITGFLPIIYVLVFIGYAYAKVSYIKDYMLLFKSLMYVSLVCWYVLTTPRISIIYLLIILFFSVADLAGINGGEVLRWVLLLFYIGNLLIVYYITRKLKEFKVKISFFKRIILILVLIVSTFIVSVFFARFKIVILGFAFSLVVLLYVSYSFYAKAISRSSFLMLAGVILLIVCYSFTAINQFLQPYKYFSLLDGVTYAVALYLITKAVLIDDNEYIENLEVIE